jgi:hypothetical protein
MTEETPATGSSNPLSNELIPVSASASIPSTPGSLLPLSNEEMQAAAATPPPVPTTPDQTALFVEVYDCAKNNHNWNKVSSAISVHPDWLTRIPQGLLINKITSIDLVFLNN